MILPATVVGRPPMEDCWLARAGGFLLLSLLKIDLPEVVALHSAVCRYFSWSGHHFGQKRRGQRQRADRRDPQNALVRRGKAAGHC